ncbi:MAG: hypothetical protein IVW54_00360 [Candidatus Binataceae bacterium]|nr:hypothetical protein [Candidatus Binataceae bacterium]
MATDAELQRKLDVLLLQAQEIFGTRVTEFFTHIKSLGRRGLSSDQQARMHEIAEIFRGITAAHHGAQTQPETEVEVESRAIRIERTLAGLERFDQQLKEINAELSSMLDR